MRVIEEWGPYGISPVVTHPRLDAELKDQLRQVFLDMDEGSEGKSILRNLLIDRFVVPDDSIYDSVREMRAYVSEHGLHP